MKTGDIVEYISEYVSSQHIGVIVAVGYGGDLVDTQHSTDLHPDIWVLTADGIKERWNERCVRVINENR
jgi:hypothetical protein